VAKQRKTLLALFRSHSAKEKVFVHGYIMSLSFDGQEFCVLQYDYFNPKRARNGAMNYFSLPIRLVQNKIVRYPGGREIDRFQNISPPMDDEIFVGAAVGKFTYTPNDGRLTVLASHPPGTS